jgi:hypothetical protein
MIYFIVFSGSDFIFQGWFIATAAAFPSASLQTLIFKITNIGNGKKRNATIFAMSSFHLQKACVALIAQFGIQPV